MQTVKIRNIENIKYDFEQLDFVDIKEVKNGFYINLKPETKLQKIFGSNNLIWVISDNKTSDVGANVFWMTADKKHLDINQMKKVIDILYNNQELSGTQNKPEQQETLESEKPC